MRRRRSQVQLPLRDTRVVTSIDDTTILTWWKGAQAAGSHRITDFRLLPSVQDIDDPESTYRTIDREPQYAPFSRPATDGDSRRQFNTLFSALPADSFRHLKSLDLHIDKDGGQKQWLFNLCARFQDQGKTNITRLKVRGVFECDDGGNGDGDDDKKCNILTFKNLEEIDFDWTCGREEGHQPHTCSAKGFNNLLKNSPKSRTIRLCFRKIGGAPTMRLKELDLCTTPISDLEELIVEGDGIDMEEEDKRRVLDVQPQAARVVFNDQDARHPNLFPPISEESSPSPNCSSEALPTYDADDELYERDSVSSSIEPSGLPGEDYTITVGPFLDADVSDQEEAEGDDGAGDESPDTFIRSAAPSPPSPVFRSRSESPPSPNSVLSLSEANGGPENMFQELQGGILTLGSTQLPLVPRPLGASFNSDVEGSDAGAENEAEDEYEDGVGNESPRVFIRSAAPSPPSPPFHSRAGSPSSSYPVAFLSEISGDSQNVLEESHPEDVILGLNGLALPQSVPRIFNVDSDSDLERLNNQLPGNSADGLPSASTSVGSFEDQNNSCIHTEYDDTDADFSEDSPEPSKTSPSSITSEPFPDTPPVPIATLGTLAKEEEDFSSQSDY